MPKRKFDSDSDYGSDGKYTDYFQEKNNKRIRSLIKNKVTFYSMPNKIVNR